MTGEIVRLMLGDMVPDLDLVDVGIVLGLFVGLIDRSTVTDARVEKVTRENEGDTLRAGDTEGGVLAENTPVARKLALIAELMVPIEDAILLALGAMRVALQG